MQHVHVGSATHHTCTAARGSMAHSTYLHDYYKAVARARAATRRERGALAVCTPFAACDGVHTYKRGHDTEACNSTHAELHVNARSNVPDQSECKTAELRNSGALPNAHAIGRELRAAHTFESFGEIHGDTRDKINSRLKKMPRAVAKQDPKKTPNTAVLSIRMRL
jgi:hypothetical protein